MSVKCQVIMDVLERIAPRYLAESWDNVGLLLGNPSQEISKVLVALDIGEALVEKAVNEKVGMIVAHHPLLFKGLKNIRTDLPLGRMIARLIQNNVAVYAAHTNLDTAKGGVNDILAARLCLYNIEPLAHHYTEKLVKLVVFVPTTHTEDVFAAITQAGAGHIGQYSHCTFQCDGTGTFMPLEGTNPFIGVHDKIERTPEIRLETILPETMTKKVVQAMMKAHPYEEVAYDLYPLNNTGRSLGIGRIGQLADAVSLADFVAQVKQALVLQHVIVAGPLTKQVKKVAVCGGSGASLIQKAASISADVIVTGDVKYHEAQEAVAAGIAVIDAGHFATEYPVVEYVAESLKKYAREGNWVLEVNTDHSSEDIFRVV